MENISGFEISISHSGKLVFLACFENKLPLGIDVQVMEKNLNLNSMLERENKTFELDKELQFMMVSSKESLGKVLRVGLLANKDIYDIEDFCIREIEGLKVYEFKFHKFKFYRGYALKLVPDYIVSFVTINSNEVLLNIIGEIKRSVFENQCIVTERCLDDIFIK